MMFKFTKKSCNIAEGNINTQNVPCCIAPRKCEIPSIVSGDAQYTSAKYLYVRTLFLFRGNTTRR